MGNSEQHDSQRTTVDQVFERCTVAVVRSMQYHLPSLSEDVVKVFESFSPEDRLPARVGTTLFKARSKQLLTTLLAELQGELQVAIKEFLASARSGKFAASNESTIPGPSAFEQQILLDRIGARMTDPAETEFQRVGWRLANMVDVLVVRPKNNPFRPAIFVRSFMRAFKLLGTRDEHLLLLTKTLDFPLTTPLRDTYRELDKVLERVGVPLVRTRGAPAGSDAHGVTWSLDTSRRSDAALSGLYEQTEQTEAAPLPEGDRQPKAESVAEPDASAEVATSTKEAVHTDGPVQPSLDRLMVQLLPLLESQLGQLDRGEAPQVLSTLVELEGFASDRHAGMALMLVRLVFDRIAQDSLIHVDFKSVILYLQLPVLLAALIDHNVLLHEEQPVRRLVNQLAAASLGWLPASRDSQDFLHAARGAVRVVVAGRGSMEAFAEALSRFEEFVAQAAASLEDPVARAKRALAEAEERQTLSVKATIDIGRQLQGFQVEPYLREFLLKKWPNVIVEMTEREKREPDIAQAYKDLVSELIWSVQPKLDRDDRSRLVLRLPYILQLLREGMQAVEMPEDQCREIMSTLMQTHSHALRAFQLAYGIDDRSQASSGLGEEALLEQIRSSNVESADAANEALSQATRLLGASLTVVQTPTSGRYAAAARSTTVQKQISEWQETMAVGAVFDMASDSGYVRLVLRWISPKRKVFLFSDVAWKQLFSFSPTALADKLASGSLRAPNSSNVFDEAVEVAVTRFGPSFLGTQGAKRGRKGK